MSFKLTPSMPRLWRILFVQNWPPRRRLTAIACVAALSMGCQLSNPLSPSSDSTTSQASSLAQYLTVTAYAKVHQDNEIGLEVASTPEQQALGLMHRSELSPDQGMLFPFDPPRPASFWMKNTVIPLDIIYLRNQKVVTIHERVPPCQTPSCPTYRSKGLIDQVIELAAGQAQSLNIREGDRIEVHFKP